MDHIQQALEHHMRFLKDTIENKRHIKDERKFKKYLEGITFYLQNYKYDISVKINIASKPCDQCGVHILITKKNESFNLNCGHSCCSMLCLRNLVGKTCKNLKDYPETKCSVCQKFILETLIMESFGGEARFRNILAEYEETNAAKFACNICLKKFRVEEGITLDCDHRFDKQCIDDYLTNLIKVNEIGEDKLKCPECEAPISTPIIKNCIEKPVWDKFVKFGLRNYNPDENDQTIVFFRCPGGNCEYFELLNKTINSFMCPSCKLVSCPKCRKPVHPLISCDENSKRLFAEDQKLLKNIIKQNGFKTCPHCKSLCERISGCNFMQCMSTMCRGKKYFCLLCERKLHESQHYNHYKASGPFGDVCNEIERRRIQPLV